MYGLALLNSDYDGNCITVRRASDNSTTNIGFSGQDLDIAALETFCSGTDGFVSVWFDQSGNSNNATQTTASSQPKIVSSGSVILENGKPSISFDGVDDCFETTNNLTNYTNPAFLAFVGQVDSFPSAVLGKLSGINRGLGFTIDDIRHRIYREGFGTNDHATTTLTSQMLVDFQMINGVSNLYENTIGIDNPQNTLQGLTFDGTTNGIGVNLALGYYDGKMQSIVLYHSDQSGNRSGIETALNDYYNIY